MVNILEDKGRRMESTHRLQEIHANIAKQIDSLLDGKYLVQSREDNDARPLSLEQHEISRYLAIKEISIGVLTIASDELEEVVIKIARRGGIFDASAVSKVYLAKLVGILSSASCRGLYLFDILRWVDRPFDERELIHSLVLHRDYEFRDLAAGIGMCPRPDTGASSGVGKVYEDDLSAAVLIGTFLAMLLPVSIFATFVFLKDWDKIEWIAFFAIGLPIIPLFSYLLTALDFVPNLGPKQLRELSRRWAQNRLQKKTKRSDR